RSIRILPGIGGRPFCPPWGTLLKGQLPFTRKDRRLYKKNLPSIQNLRSGHCIFFYLHWVVPTIVFTGKEGPCPIGAPTRRFPLFLYISPFGTVPLENRCKKLN